MYEGIGVVDFSTGRSRRWAEVETDWCENPFMRARSLHAKLKQQPRGLATFCEDGMGAHSRKSRSEKEAHSVAQIPTACSSRRFAGDPGGSEGSTCVFKSHRRPTAELHTARLRCGQSGLSVRGDHRALFLSERSNRCRTNGSTSEPSSATKNGPMGHETRNEIHVA